MNLPIALTMGDPAGIGGEISVAAWQRAKTRDDPFFLIADVDYIRGIAARSANGAAVEEIDDPAQAGEVFARALPVLQEKLPSRQLPGIAEPANAGAVIRSIERAVSFAQAGQVAGVVTNPINKKALYDGAGFAFPGHTEFLGHLGCVDQTVMMLAAPILRVVPVTIHVSLREACDLLSTELIVDTARILHADLQRYFGLTSPRIAVSGLNPHAGEGGTMGREEITMIEPAVRQLRGEGIEASGPWPGDTMFHATARAEYDVALCMYHDQALIPLKALDFAQGVNVTLGLPFIRTSPDHGTAYNIAGSGKADPTSLTEALRMASNMARAVV